MVIVNISNTTHDKLKQTKKIMKKSNKPIYKINNDTVLNHALNKLEEKKEYELK